MSSRARPAPRTPRSTRLQTPAGEKAATIRVRRRQLRVVALVVALVLAAGWMSASFSGAGPLGAGPPDVASDVRSEVSDEVDAFVTGRMEAHGIPGAAVAVVRGGEVVHRAGYGAADPSGRPVTADTPFLIASVSKPLTATAVLRLVEEGRLSLDEPVAPYLAGVVDDLPEGFDEVTVEQLLTHTGGLGMLPGTAGAHRIHRGDDALERRVTEILARPPSRKPGTAFSYSNGGYTLLAAVIEQVTGTAYDEHMRERIFEPLGMAGSFASDRDPRAEQLATGHSRWFGRWRPRDLPYDPAGAAMGYLGSTAKDLGGFLQAHLGTDHADVVSPQLRALAHRRAVADTGMGDSMQTGYAMGWFVGDLAGHPTVSHSGELGHFTTHVNLVPDADLGVAVLTNGSAVVAGQGGNYHLARDLTGLLVGKDVEPASPKVLTTGVLPVAVWAGALAIVLAAGRYLLITLPRRRAAPATGSPASRWLRPVVLPAAGYFAVALPLLTVAPLGLARHMAPDTGWGLTAVAYLALTWAVMRTPLAISAARGRTRAGTSPPASDGSPGPRRTPALTG